MNKRRGLPCGETLFSVPGSTLSLTRSSGHLISQLLLSIFIRKTTVKAERPDVEVETEEWTS